ncbi:MAG: GFA family protein, partial [Gammaproteobacteria bacterium]|nr:GFA family protein [Gammaproteobacteria bacterium]
MEGACAGGTITYRGDPVRLVNCHCNLHRRINGPVFSSYIVAQTKTLAVLDPKSSLHRCAVTDCSTKPYCGNCGTPLYNSDPSAYPGHSMIYLGIGTSAVMLKPDIHIFRENKLPWIDALASQH